LNARARIPKLRRIDMKLRRSTCVTIVAMLICATTVALAKSGGSGTVHLPYDTTLGGSHLASGSYKVQWVTHSPEATVSFMHKSKVMATAEGKVVDRGKRYASNMVVYLHTDNGGREIQELRFEGSSQVIVFKE
jgi:hypothetical protein